MTGVSGNNRNTPPHWDIALLGLWWSCNYGAVLTSFSLHCVLSRQGYRVLLLDHAPMTMASHVNDPGSVFRTFFREEGIESIPISSRRDAERTNRLADTFIAGSDQLWNYKYTHNQDMQYYLDFVDGEKRKIAYATSLGDLPVQPPQDYLDRIPRYLDCFHAISVREGDSVRTLRERYHISATHLVDPVFLTSMEDCNRLTQKASPMPDGMLTYFLDITESYGQACAAISRELALPSAHLLDPSGDMELKKQYFPEGRVHAAATIYEWVRAFQDCKCVITDSFHGTCFAIIFNKPFLCIKNAQRGATRFTSLLKQFGLEDRLIHSHEELPGKIHLLRFMDEDAVSLKKHSLKQRALDWLQTNLSNPVSEETKEKGIRCRQELSCWRPSWKLRLRRRISKLARYCLNEKLQKKIFPIMGKLIPRS